MEASAIKIDTRSRSRHIPAGLLLIALFLWAMPLAAQSKAYRIGPRDVLNLEIHAGGAVQYQGPLTVSEDGSINTPFIGTVQARGLSPSELEKRIAEPLSRDYFVDPKVSLSVKEYHSLHYYISGAVKKPGLFETDRELNLLELITKAEGVTPERGTVAYIMREAAAKVREGTSVEALAESSEPLKVDLQRLLDKGDLSANPALQPGDVVYLPPQKSLNVGESKIYVEGEVKSPGIFDFQPGMTALNACIQAGGFDRFAAPNRTRIIRGKGENVEIIKINLDKVKDGALPDVPLQPGDRIHVPESWL